MNTLIKFSKARGPKALRQVQEEIPKPNENEVVVQMKAAGLNRSEHMFMTGVYVIQPEFPSKVGTEGAGIIHSIGKNVTDFKVGDAVCITPNILPNEYGALAEYALIPKEALVEKPDFLSFEEGASIWMALATAYCALVTNGGMKKNDNKTIVVTAASSAIGAALMQMAKFYGAKVIATSRTSEKDKFLKANGADHIIHTYTESLEEKINEFTDSRGFDIAIDLVLGDFTEKLANAAAPEAIIIAGGLLSMEVPQIPFFPMVMKNLKLTSFHVVFHLFRKEKAFEEARKVILEGLENGSFKPIIDTIFPFENTTEAYEYLEGNQQRGKVVIEIA